MLDLFLGLFGCSLPGWASLGLFGLSLLKIWPTLMVTFFLKVSVNQHDQPITEENEEGGDDAIDHPDLNSCRCVGLKKKVECLWCLSKSNWTYVGHTGGVTFDLKEINSSNHKSSRQTLAFSCLQNLSSLEVRILKLYVITVTFVVCENNLRCQKSICTPSAFGVFDWMVFSLGEEELATLISRLLFYILAILVTAWTLSEETFHQIEAPIPDNN